jgi:hypothetical protein
MFDLRTIARALGGEVVNGQVLAPGPNHTPKDRSMSVRLSANSPDGFLVFSHCGDDFRDCRDHVRERLGLPPDGWKRDNPPSPRSIAAPARAPVPDLKTIEEDAERTESALTFWKASGDPRGTLGETYLASRGLDLPADMAGEVLRWNRRANCLVALFRNVHTGEPQAVTRIYVDTTGRKLGRKFLGPVAAAAVMLDPFENVSYGLFVGEGVETCMAGRQMAFRPAWALGSAGAIERLPLFAGVDALTVFAETDDSGANARAIEAVGRRWRAARREVYVVTPEIGGDMNDALQGRRA